MGNVGSKSGCLEWGLLTCSSYEMCSDNVLIILFSSIKKKKNIIEMKNLKK